MPSRVSEAIVLRTYPLKEADLIVSFLTRDQGKLRGVAKRARRPKSAFGSGLERLSQVKLAYYQRENRELVNLDSCDLIHSQFALLSNIEAGVALDFVAEVCEQLLPPAEPNDRFFRLLNAVLEYMRGGGPGAVWRCVTYFSLWAVRLSGFLPELHVCLACGSWLDDPAAPERAFYLRYRPGLLCEHCRKLVGGGDTWELRLESRVIAEEMLRKPIGELAETRWSKETCADLRHFLVQQLENHIERRLVTAPILEAV